MATVAKPNAVSQQTAHRPTFKAMIIEAIESLSPDHNRKGVSIYFIKQYLNGKFDVDVDKQMHNLKKSLKSAVDQGDIIQVTGKGASGSFKLSAKFSKEGSKPKAVKKMMATKKKPIATADPTVKKTVKKPLSPVQNNKKATAKPRTQTKQDQTDSEKPKALVKPSKATKLENKENAQKDAEKVTLKRGKGKLKDANNDDKQSPVKMKKLANLEQKSDEEFSSGDESGNEKKVALKRGGAKMMKESGQEEEPIATKKLKKQIAVDQESASEEEDVEVEAEEQSEFFDETTNAEGAEEMFDKLKSAEEPVKNKPTVKSRPAASEAEPAVGKRTRQGSVVKEPVKQKTRKAADSKK